MQANSPAHYQVGDLDITVVADGTMRLDGGAVFGVVPRVMWEPAIGSENIDSEHRIELGLNCLIVRSGDDIVLIETGMGNKVTGATRDKVFPGNYGHLLDRLALSGVTIEAVTAVVNTHLHADHCGWNTVERNGEVVPTFPNARYFISRGEYETAMHPNERTRATYLRENFEPLERAGQLELAGDEQLVAPGIHFLSAPGHTADHSAIVLNSKGETAYYLGDLIQHASHLERNAWIPAFDVLPLVSLETKKRLLDRAIAENALLLSTHMAYPGAGHLRESGGRRTFVPAAAS
jgi:glyoxylase-like metal-dependent hydrolase (beta-lactamase superfamily II)